MICTTDNIILVSASNENVFASLIIYHKLPIELCLYVPPSREYRDLVVKQLKGKLTEQQLIGCFTVEEKEALLKKEGAKKRGKATTVQSD